MKRTILFLTCLLSSSAWAGARSLTLDQAREQAVAKHPQITAAELLRLASQQTVLQNRAAYLPSMTLNAGGVITTHSGLQAASPGLAMSGMQDRASVSMTASQLITDFGRTTGLIASARLRAAAEGQSALATRAQILLEVDAAYYSILQSQALLAVARQAVETRGLLRDNTVSLQKNQLKSEIDVSFAEVTLKDAELLLSRSQNDVKSAQATLARLLMDPENTEYSLAAPRQPAAMPGNVDKLAGMASLHRPELERLRLERDAAWKFLGAEKALGRPTLSLQGTAGTLPWNDGTPEQNYAVGGILLSWPIMTGGLNRARRQEAELRAQAAEQRLKDEEARVRRDVEIAWLNATNAAERLEITGRLREQASQAYSLAEARFKAGSSSVVELSQSQLTLTASEINQTTTRYEYLLSRSILDFQTGEILKRAAKAAP